MCGVHTSFDPDCLDNTEPYACSNCGYFIDYLPEKEQTQDVDTPSESFSTGAVRDKREGKGRYDLISPIALRRLALAMEEGSQKYSERNWEKGMPICRMMDSALRHLNQYLEGQRDEDHLAHAMFNVMGMIHMEEMIEKGLMPKELDDRPNYTKESHVS